MIKLIQCSETHGDCTAEYSVILDKSYTVEEFINEVLTKNEWGYIGIYNEGQAWFDFGDPNCEYKYDKLVTQMPEDILKEEISEVKASGGWSRMDYLLTL